MFTFPYTSFSPDSEDSLPSNLWNFDKVSLLGNSPKPWLTNFLYSVVPSSFLSVFQLIISGFVCTLLLIQVSKVFTNYHKARCFTLFLLTLILASNTLISWDNLANIQSLTNSAVILFVALLIRLYMRCNTVSALLLLGSEIILCVQRPIFLPVVLIANLIVIGKREILNTFAKAFSFIVLTTLISAYIILHSVNQNNFWPGSISGISIAGQLKTSSPVSLEFREFLKSKRVPDCIIERDRLALVNSDDSQVCDDGIVWASSEAVPTYLNFLIMNPDLMIKVIGFGFYGFSVNSSINYGNSATIVPPLFETFLIGGRTPMGNGYLNSSDTYWQTKEVVKYFLYSPVYSYIVLYFLLFLLFKPQNLVSFREIRMMNFIPILLVANLLVVAVQSLIIYTEWTRILFPNLLLCSILLTLGFGVCVCVLPAQTSRKVFNQ